MRAPRLAVLVAVACLAPACSRGAEDVRAGRETDQGQGYSALSTVPGQEQRIGLLEVSYKYDLIDPKNDGWESEAAAGRVHEQLKRLEELLAAPRTIDADSVQDVARHDFECARPRGSELEVGFDGPALLVRRGVFPAPSLEVRGPAALASALEQLREGFDVGQGFHAHFKVVGIELGSVTSARFTTEVLLQASGTQSGKVAQGSGQLSAAWDLEWHMSRDDEVPLLLSLAPRSFEWVVTKSGGTLFEDCTEAVLGHEPSFQQQLSKSHGHWASQLDKRLGVDIVGHLGLAVGDANGDGLDDLYVCQMGGLPNLLYLQQPDGTAKEVGLAAGVAYLDATRSALFVDFDNDGDQDLMLGGEILLILANDGTGRFSLKLALPISNVYSQTAADHDLDGDLDVYLCRYNGSSSNVPIPYHDANNGLENILLVNDGAGEGEWRFRDATDELGLGENNRRFSFAAAWVDYDEDGDADLYVANDFGRNNLYQNTAGHFRDVAADAGVEDISAGMSVAWGDVNGDGHSDLYVSNMFSSAGNRITFQRNFRAGDERGLTDYRRHARGNSLFINRGDGRFDDASVGAAVTMGRWAWGSVFADLNNDGLEDLMVANGNITNEDPDDL